MNADGKINLLPPAEPVSPVLGFLVVLNAVVASTMALLVLFIVLVRRSRTVRGWTRALIQWLDQ